MAECFIYGQDSGSNTNFNLIFKEENMLLDVAQSPTSVSFLTITRDDNNKVIVNVPDADLSSWYQLFNTIQFKINTFYKLTVSNFQYGRIGISNKNGNPHNGQGSTVITTNTNACVFTKVSAKEDEIGGDNYLISADSYTAYFTINLDAGSDSLDVQSGSLWFCSDLEYEDERKGYSFEISLQEQDTFEFA